MRAATEYVISIKKRSLILDRNLLHKLEEPEEALTIADYITHISFKLELTLHNCITPIKLTFIHLTPDVVCAFKTKVGLFALIRSTDLGNLPVSELGVDWVEICLIRYLECEACHKRLRLYVELLVGVSQFLNFLPVF